MARGGPAVARAIQFAAVTVTCLAGSRHVAAQSFHLSPRTAAPSPSRAPTVEATDPALKRSLALLTIAATGEHHRQVADQYLRLRVVDAAYTHYAAAVQIDSEDGLAHAGLSAVWREWGYDEPALAEAYRAVYFAPNAASAYNALGVAFASLGLVDAARDAFGHAHRLDPSASYPVANLCSLALDQDRVDTAIAFCSEAVGLTGAASETHVLYGSALARTGDFAAAHDEFLRAGNRADAAYELGKAYLRAGRNEDAARAFRSVAAANPSATRAIEQLRLLSTRERGEQ